MKAKPLTLAIDADKRTKRFAENLSAELRGKRVGMDTVREIGN